MGCRSHHFLSPWAYRVKNPPLPLHLLEKACRASLNPAKSQAAAPGPGISAAFLGSHLSKTWHLEFGPSSYCHWAVEIQGQKHRQLPPRCWGKMPTIDPVKQGKEQQGSKLNVKKGSRMDWSRGSVSEDPPDGDNPMQNQMQINHKFILQKSTARRPISGKSHLMNSTLRPNAFCQVLVHQPASS